MSSFKHPDLRFTQSARLLILNPAFSRNAPLECHLRTFNLSTLPRYEALSYTWDRQKLSRTIICNGSKLHVTPNVEAALKQLRRGFFRRKLWIDAICIDQNNLDERSSQVRLMDQIFHGASQVIVWLGEGDKSTTRAISAFKWWFPLWKLSLVMFPFRYMKIRAFEKAKADFQSVLLSNPDDNRVSVAKTSLAGKDLKLHGLRQLVHHNWFRRIWTIQEIALAKRAVLRCGSSKLRWSALSTTLTFEDMLFEKRPPTPVLADGGYNPNVPIYNRSPFMIRMQQIQLLRERLRIAGLDRSTGRHHFRGSCLDVLPFIHNLLLTGLNPEYMTTDERDRVFGLTSILRTLGIEVNAANYKKSLPDIVFETFRTIAERENSLELLHLVTGKISLPNLPSWIPGFEPVPWCPPRDTLGDLTGPQGITLGNDFTIQGRKLSFTGIQVDFIRSITNLINSQEPQHPTTDWVLLNHSEAFIHSLRQWIRFLEGVPSYRELSKAAQKSFLFKILLHSQVLRCYEDAGTFEPRRKLYRSRLLGHFSHWVDKVESQDPMLTLGNDYEFEIIQHASVSSPQVTAI
ncbi:hypothetical protein L207DRAFT_637515 [Hyaloscypha variabilis F]|uniref:Heterokaryon incompatibility domain-containing protein n=1 Tax=Hyaloscypha variabilis (strain UAMH 11265 / GT02V1 / F) TaxID=1149755 RepID=A0A2J6RD32_HYAVF|nr:hypothetical protein L207DRAFT_637515 [Hyaloscypha variabilis F]